MVSRWVRGPYRGRYMVVWRLVPSVVSWAIWKDRNGRIFEGKIETIGEVFEKVKWQLIGWIFVCKELAGLALEDFYLSWEGCIRGVGKDKKPRVEWITLAQGASSMWMGSKG